MSNSRARVKESMKMLNQSAQQSMKIINQTEILKSLEDEFVIAAPQEV
jgi:hypothetical protein